MKFGPRVRSVGILVAVVLAAQMSVAPLSAAGRSYDAPRAALDTAVDDYARTVVEGGLLGALSGAAVGAIGGALTGDTANIGRGALMGGVLGGFGGLVDGTDVAEKKRRQARAEDGLDSAIRNARTRNGKLARVVRAADSLVGARRAELARLETEEAGGSARRAEFKRALDEDVSELDQAIAKARTARDEAKSLVDRYRDAPRGGGLQKELSSNEAAVRRLTEDRTQLRSIGAGL